MHRNSDVFLAYAVAADHSHFEGEGAAIAVTVSDVLSIVVPATSTSPVQYIDISLEDISEVEIQKTMLQPKSSQSNHEPVEVTDLLVRLFSGQGKNYRLNAAFHHTKELHITYQHLEEAEDIASYIKEEQATRKEHSVVHSMAVDKLSVVPGELAISKPDAQARNGSQAPSIIADQGRVTVVSASQQITELSSKILQNSDRDTTTTSKISYSAPLATEAAIQLTGAEHGVGTLAATETLVEPLDRRNGLPKPELNSSDKWQEGKAIIEDAKEFRSPSAEPRVRTPSTDTHRSVSPSPAAILEDEGLYDVSPRGAKLQEVRRSSQQSDPVGFLRDDNHPDLGTATERKNVTNMPATQGRKLKDLLRDQDGRQSKEVLGKDLPLPRPDGMTSALTSNKRVRKKPSTYANPKPRTKVQYQSEKQDVNRIDTEGTENDAPDPDIYEFPSSEQQGPDPKSKRIPGKSASRAAAAKDKAQKTQTSSRSQALGRPSEIQVVKDAVASLPPPPAEETLGDTKGKVELRDPTNRDEVFKVKETKAVVVTRRPGQKRDSNAERSSAVKPDTVIASVETSAPIPPSAIKEHSSNLQTKAAKPTKPSKPTKPTKPKKPTKKQKPKVVISEPRSTRAAALKANQKILKLNLAEQGENGDIEVGANKHESPPPEQEPPATETVPPSEAVYKVPIVNLLAGSRGQRSRRRRVSSNVPEKEVNGLSIESNKADAVNSRQESTIHGSADPVPGSQGQASNKGRNQGGVEIPDSEEVSDSEEVNIVECPSPIEAEGAPSGPVNHHFDDAVLVMQDDGIEVPEVEAPREPVVAVLAAQNAQDYARGIKRQSMASKIKGSLASLSLAPDQDDHVQMPTSILKKRQDIKKELPTANNVPINRTSTRHSPVMEKRPIRTPTHAAIRHVTLPSGSEPAKRAAKHLHKSPSQIKSTKSVHMLQQTNDVTLRTSSSERHSHSQQSEVISISSNGSENDTYYTDEGDEEIEPLKIPQPENKSKRRADDIDLEHISKKAKANAESKKRASTPVAQRKASPDRQKVPTPVLVDDYLQRKAPIISFSAKGPRNQGVKLAKKTSKSPQDNIENNTETEKNLTFKRKREGGVDKWANAAAQTPLAKRRRASITVPHTREYVPELAPESSSPPITEVSHQQGSKKRVAENGSPIPTVQYLDLSKGPYERLHDLFVNGDGHLGDDESVSFGDHLAEDDILLPRDGLPVPRNEEPQRTDPEEMILSSNRKPPPDSPSAPSKTLAAFSAHRVQSGGKFVNVKTAKVVKTAEPQDPFISVKPVRSSSFLEKLRAKNNLGNNEVLSRSKDVPQLPPVQPQEEDPDKTLVDDLPGESDVLSPPSEIASATSKSSRSTSTARHTDESRAESEPDLEREWREALKPHQRNMLDILYQISNVCYPCQPLRSILIGVLSALCAISLTRRLPRKISSTTTREVECDS